MSSRTSTGGETRDTRDAEGDSGASEGSGRHEYQSWTFSSLDVSSEFPDADLPLLDQLRMRQKTRRDVRLRETEILGHLERTYRSRIAQLEQQVASLQEQGKVQRRLHEQELRQKQADADKMREVLHRELTELQRRQETLEAAGPAFHAQLQAARDQLRDVHVSDAMYAELSRIPEDDRLLADAVRLTVYEALRDLRAENERLRRASEGDREAAARAEEERERHRRAAAAAEARAAERTREAAREVDTLSARLERVENELSEALLRCEVLGAKGSMFDEVKGELDALRQAHEGALAEMAALRRMQDDFQDLRTQHRDATHRLELLAQDRAHVVRQAELLQHQVQRLEEEGAAKDARVAELKAARDRLQERLMAGATDSRAEYEARVQGEIAQIRAESEREVDRVRREMEHGYDRELRVVRELRDAAVQDARRAEEKLEQVRQQLEASVADHQARSKAADVREAQLLGRVEVLLLERQQLQATADERGARCAALQAEADQAAERARHLRERLHAMEHEMARRTADLEARLEGAEDKLRHYELLESQMDQAILSAGAAVAGAGETPGAVAAAAGDEGGGGVVAAWPEGGGRGVVAPRSAAAVIQALEGAVPMAVRRRVKQALVLAARCSDLEVSLGRAEAQAREAEERARSLEAELQVARSRADRVGQPQSFVLDEMDRLEVRAMRAERRAKQLTESLRQAGEERGQLRRDLEALLEDQASLDALREAVAAGAARGAGGAGPAGPRTTPPRPTRFGPSAASGTVAGPAQAASRPGSRPLSRQPSAGGAVTKDAEVSAGSNAGSGGGRAPLPRAGAAAIAPRVAARPGVGRSKTMAVISVR